MGIVNINPEVIMYQTKDGLTKIETAFDGDTVCYLLTKLQNYFNAISVQ